MAGEDERVLADPVVTAIASAHGRTAAQVTLRWAVQRGTVPIPKTQTAPHLKENLALYDFALNADEMTRIDALDRHRRFNDPGDFGAKAFNTFIPIFD
jgi:D-xylose reductase